MLKTYTWPRYTSPRAPELDAPAVRQVPLVVVGAGPVGLSAAIDAALRGLPVILLDDDNTVSIGSRGLCYAKRTLEIFDRLGVGNKVVSKGVTWNVGRTFHRDREVFSFNLLPEPGHQRPGMVNLQQYHLEQYLVERAMTLPLIELRWRHKVAQVTQVTQVTQAAQAAHIDAGATLTVETAEGPYTLRCDWLIVADGARSPIRRQLGLDMEGKVFQDRFLIADVLLEGEPFPAERTERRFWFDPPFHRARGNDDQGIPRSTSALMHREADQVWRFDFQLGWDADPELERQPERVLPRIRAALDGQGFAKMGFELEWASVYTFQCRRMAEFRHGRLLFVGDAAHQVSPFGARGANSGVQDTDNLLWKLQLVMAGLAPPSLLDSYSSERGFAADENLLNSTRATDFMTPKSRAAQVQRDAVLTLAAEFAFARALVNSGRLSVPAILTSSALNTPDIEPFEGWMSPGAPLSDAPVHVSGADGWLLPHIGPGFVLMHFGAPDAAALSVIDRLALAPIPLIPLFVMPAGEAWHGTAAWVEDIASLAARRCDARPGTVYLLRPDQHVAARWRRLDAAAVLVALARATGQERLN